MLFWILVAALVAVVTLAITRPLLRDAGDPQRTADADIAVYKDQLKEVASDAARGTLGAAEAESARAEIARRLLRSAESRGEENAGADVMRRRFAKPVYVAMSVALPVASLALYLTFGAPGMPGQPLDERLAQSNRTSKPNDLVAKVEERLRQHPEDGTGWDVIAPVYYAMGRFADAADAYGKALQLVGESLPRLQGFADARIRAENGVIPEDAKKALQRVLVIAPDSKEPLIWLALAKEQDGRLADAAADYKKLLAEAPADVPWRKMIEGRLAELQSPAKSDATAPNPPNASSAAEAAPGSTPDPAMVAGMTPEQRQAFIGRMVDGLAARLKTDGTDAAGWLKLIRAYQVLGRRDDAVKALSAARTGLKGDEVGLARVEDLARQLGLGS